MSQDRSVKIGQTAAGNVIITGDNNRVKAQIDALVKTLPPRESVDLPRELEMLRSILQQLGGENTGKVTRAFEDASEEAQKPQPDKKEVGSALQRALEYSKATVGFTEQVTKIAPHLAKAVAWLGSEWHHLLSFSTLPTG